MRDVSWFRAHVQAGRSYPLVAVRVCERVAPGGGIVQVLDSEDPTVLRTAAYAIETARALDQLGAAVGVLELDASLLRSNGGVLLDLWLEIDASAHSIGEALVEGTARQVLVQGSAAGRWQFAEPLEIRVALVSPAPPPHRGEATAVRAQKAKSGAAGTSPAITSESDDDTPEREQAARTDVSSACRGGLRGGLVAAVVVGLGALALVAIAVNAQILRGNNAPDATDDVVTLTRTVNAPVVTDVVALATAAIATAAAAADVAGVPAAAEPTTSPAAAVPAAPASEKARAAAAAPAGEAAAPPGVSAAEPKPPLLDFAAGRTSGVSWPNDRQGGSWFDVDGFHLAARTPGHFVAIGVLPNQQLRGALVTGTFHKVGGPAGGGYGLIVGDDAPASRDGTNQGGRYFVFEVGDTGDVSVWRRDQDQWLQILGWTPNPVVKSGRGENTLAVRVSGGGVGFSVNQTDISVPATAQPTAGGVGVFLGGDANEAVVSRLSVTELD